MNNATERGEPGKVGASSADDDDGPKVGASEVQPLGLVHLVGVVEYVKQVQGDEGQPQDAETSREPQGRDGVQVAGNDSRPADDHGDQQGAQGPLHAPPR